MKAHSHIHAITQRNVEAITRLKASAEKGRTFGEHVADIASVTIGSWPFLIIQSVLLVIWMILNVTGESKSWDPYPFILLNLVLSFQAAFATPILLMSGNRQARLSERRNELDLQINLLAEQENTEQLRLLRLLCEKAGIAVTNAEGQALSESVSPEAIIKQIVEIGEKIANPRA